VLLLHCLLKSGILAVRGAELFGTHYGGQTALTIWCMLL